MPAGDGTGPMGMGPMSGRGAGYCGGYDAPGAANWGGEPEGFVTYLCGLAGAAIGLAILVVLFRSRHTIDVEELDSLKG